MSQASFTNAAAPAAVLARSEDFADALTAGPLASALGGPLLLTSRATLDERVRDEVARVLPPGGIVTLVGGTSALSAAVADSLTSAGFGVRRVAGEDRYATATAVADAVVGATGTPPRAALLATGTGFADGLVAGPAATRVAGVVLLTSGSTMPSTTSAWLAAHPDVQSYAIGGPARAAAPAAIAIVGTDRFATATAVASRFFSGPTVVGVVSGVVFPDALVGAARLGALRAPLLLSAPDALSPATESYLSALSPRATSFEIYGGPSALSSTIDDSLRSLAA